MCALFAQIKKAICARARAPLAADAPTAHDGRLVRGAGSFAFAAAHAHKHAAERVSPLQTKIISFFPAQSIVQQSPRQRLDSSFAPKRQQSDNDSARERCEWKRVNATLGARAKFALRERSSSSEKPD